MKKFVLFAGLFLMCSTCLWAEKKVMPTDVTFDLPTILPPFFVGQNFPIPYTVYPEGADETVLQWETTDPTTITTDNTNILKFMKEGKATISVTMIGKSEPLAFYEFEVISNKCGDNLYWSLSPKPDGTYLLEFWQNEVGAGTHTTPGDGTYSMYDYYQKPISPGITPIAPWIEPWGPFISEIAYLDNVERIASYAFANMPLLNYVYLYKNNSLGQDVFWGDSLLNTIEISDKNYYIHIEENSLILDDTGREIGIVVVPDEETKLMYETDNGSGVKKWNKAGRVFTVKDGEWNSTHWEVGQSDSLKTLRLQIGSSWVSTEEDSYVIPDMDDPSESPWAQLGDNVQDLVIGEKISYIGRNAFASLTNLQTIQFHQWDVPLESIHIEAFDKSITPWKFAMGDPQDGPILPPKIVGLTEENKDLLDLFAAQTVLYVPDSTFILDGKEVSSIELYKNDPFWGKFNRVTDRTVALEDVQDVSVEMSWLPLEHAEAYLLTISKKDCLDCDTTIEIKALGGKGLIDWEHNEIPEYLAAKRAPKSDDGQGGMTITIKIKVGGGTAPNTDVKVEASGLKEDSEYEYKREVIITGGVKNPGLGKAGEFTTKAKEIPQSIGQNESDTSRVLCTKILRDGQIYLQLPDGQVFNSLGIRIR